MNVMSVNQPEYTNTTMNIVNGLVVTTTDQKRTARVRERERNRCDGNDNDILPMFFYGAFILQHRNL